MHRRISNLCQKCTRSASLSLSPCQAPCLSPRPLCSPSSVIVCSSCLCIVSGGSAPPGTAQRRLCCLGCKRWCSAGPADGPTHFHSHPGACPCPCPCSCPSWGTKRRHPPTSSAFRHYPSRKISGSSVAHSAPAPEAVSTEPFRDGFALDTLDQVSSKS